TRYLYITDDRTAYDVAGQHAGTAGIQRIEDGQEEASEDRSQEIVRCRSKDGIESAGTRLEPDPDPGTRGSRPEEPQVGLRQGERRRSKRWFHPGLGRRGHRLRPDHFLRQRAAAPPRPGGAGAVLRR